MKQILLALIFVVLCSSLRVESHEGLQRFRVTMIEGLSDGDASQLGISLDDSYIYGAGPCGPFQTRYTSNG